MVNRFHTTEIFRIQEGEIGDKSSSDAVAQVPPHCHITIKCTKEVIAIFTLLKKIQVLEIKIGLYHLDYIAKRLTNLSRFESACNSIFE